MSWLALLPLLSRDVTSLSLNELVAIGAKAGITVPLSPEGRDGLISLAMTFGHQKVGDLVKDQEATKALEAFALKFAEDAANKASNPAVRADILVDCPACDHTNVVNAVIEIADNGLQTNRYLCNCSLCGSTLKE